MAKPKPDQEPTACGDCKYFLGPSLGDLSRCHAHPPAALDGYPAVGITMLSCGEFAAKPKKPKNP